MNTEQMIDTCLANGLSVDFTAKNGVWIWHYPENGHAAYVQADTFSESYSMAKEKGWINAEKCLKGRDE